MRRAASYSALRRCAVSAAAAVLLVVPVPVRSHAQDEVRALWVVRTSLTSPAAVATMVDTARASGFNTLLIQIRGRADAYDADALEPIADAAADDTIGVVRHIVSRYAIDGAHFDYVRYPSDEVDDSRDALAALRRTVLRERPPAEAGRYEGRAATEPLIDTQAFPDAWGRFRAGRMTALMSRLRDTMKAVRPSATVSAAVIPDATDAATRRLQDWRAWLDRGLVDVICPTA
jgi:uncharacterized lipoprotein YddW (UPF0748 family)